ncbi:hypothetical protein BJ742DRAFT_53806 [Cladochytrium replicatum]|nr:hypothetical protein BJ742DRAFT_53806 [Cladochytrium replicatum]
MLTTSDRGFSVTSGLPPPSSIYSRSSPLRTLGKNTSALNVQRGAVTQIHSCTCGGIPRETVSSLRTSQNEIREDQALLRELSLDRGSKQGKTNSCSKVLQPRNNNNVNTKNQPTIQRALSPSKDAIPPPLKEVQRTTQFPRYTGEIQVQSGDTMPNLVSGMFSVASEPAFMENYFTFKVERQFHDVREKVSRATLKNRAAYKVACNGKLKKGNAKTLPPSLSWVHLIALAFHSAGKTQMTVKEIYQQIIKDRPHFAGLTSSNWKNAVRHALSVNKAFYRSNDREYKGGYWLCDDLQSIVDTAKAAENDENAKNNENDENAFNLKSSRM